ncbi:UNVERIFIED_ORG: hypothetical protein GGE11_001609 [Mycolicibacterium obuense]
MQQTPEPFAWVAERVRPHREKLVQKPKLVARWWRYERDAKAMREAVARLDEVLVLALVSKFVMPVRVPTGQVFVHSLGIFATDSFAEQAILSSVIHQLWAITYGSTLETRVRYTPTDVIETFPRPKVTASLERIGRALESERREIMLRRNLGLTKLYNIVHDAEAADTMDKDAARLRALHVELDEAVVAAYGWSDIRLDHGFHTYRQVEGFSVSPAARVEILDRLLEENHRRAQLEGRSVPQKQGKLFS